MCLTKLYDKDMEKESPNSRQLHMYGNVSNNKKNKSLHAWLGELILSQAREYRI